MIKVKHAFQAYHLGWMLLAFAVMLYGIGLARGDARLGPTLRELGPYATIVVGFHAFFHANRRRSGRGIGPIQALLEGREDVLPRSEERTHA
jgi:hypothetical protein